MNENPFLELKQRMPGLEAAAVSDEVRKEREERIARAAGDFTFFCSNYLQDYFFCEPAAYQRILYDVIQRREMTSAQAAELRKLMPAAFHSFLKPCSSLKGIVDVEPRGHGKSTRMTFAYPLWCALFEKAHFILVIGASGEDAELQMDSMRNTIENNDRIMADFGDMKGGTWNRKHLLFSNGVAVMARGKGGSLRGRRNRQYRPDLVIVDDTFKDNEAESSAIREKVSSWFSRTVLPLGKDALFVVVNTITNEDDLPSRLLNDIKGGRKNDWLGLRFSAEVPPEDGQPHGTPLWPQRYSWDDLKNIERNIGTLAYAQEYLSQPLSDADRIFKKAWFRIVGEADVPGDIRTYQGLDPATGAHDQSAEVTAAKSPHDPRIFIMASCGKTESVSSFISRIIRSYARWRYRRMSLEVVAFQSVLKDQIMEKAAEAKIILPLRGVKPGRASKSERLMAISPMVENGIVVFLPGNEALVDQLTGFPAAGFDDLCDAFYYAVLSALAGGGGGGISISNAAVRNNWRRLAKI